MQRLSVVFALVLVLLALLITAALASPIAAASAVDNPDAGAQIVPEIDEPHQPPVDAPVIDVFRPPTGPYGSGNRGLEYDTSPGQNVHASAAGVVTFSGQVGGHLFVTIRHSPSLRTTVGFVDAVLVGTGDRVSKGQVIAIAGHTMHFTARQRGTYIDPMLLFQRYRVVVRLVAGPS